MFQYLKAKFTINHRQIKELIKQFNTGQSMDVLLEILGQVYLNSTSMIFEFAREHNCGSGYLGYQTLVEDAVIAHSVLRQAILEHKTQQLLDHFQKEMKYPALMDLQFDFGQMMCSDFRVWSVLNEAQSRLIDRICSLSTSSKHNDDRAADQLVQLLGESYKIRDVSDYKQVFRFSSVDEKAEVLLFYRIIVTPVMHVQFLKFEQHIERMKTADSASLLREPAFMYELEQRLARLEVTVLNVYREPSFSAHNLDLPRLFWELRNCNSGLSLYFHTFSLAEFQHVSFASVWEQFQAGQFRECRPTSSAFYLVKQFLAHKYVCCEADLWRQCNLYDSVLCCVFGQNAHGDEYSESKYMLDIDEFCSAMKSEPPAALEWYPHPLDALLHDLRFMCLEDFLAVIKPMETSVLNVLFRATTVREFIELMVRAGKLGHLHRLLQNITLPYDSNYRHQQLHDDLGELQREKSEKFDIFAVKLREQYAFFEYVLKAEQISFVLDRLDFIMRSFTIKVPRIPELEQQIDEPDARQLACAVRYAKQRQLSALQPLLDYKDHIIFNLLQQVENEQQQIEPDWRKWENKKALQFLNLLNAAKENEKPLVVQQQFQFTFRKILVLLQYNGKIQSKYSQLINKFGKLIQQFGEYFGRQFALYFAIKFLINNAQVFKFVLYQSLYDQKMCKLIKGNGASLQFLMNVHLHILDIQQPIIEVYFMDIYNEALAYYKLLGPMKETRKRLETMYNSRSELFQYYLFFVMMCQLPELTQKQFILLQQARKSHLENILYFLFMQREEVIALFPDYGVYLKTLELGQISFEQFYFTLLSHTAAFIRSDVEELLKKNQYVLKQVQDLYDDASSQDYVSVTSYTYEAVEFIQAFDSRIDAFSDIESQTSEVSGPDVDFDIESDSDSNIEYE